MDKISNLMGEINCLREKEEQAKKLIDEMGGQYYLKYQEIAKAYQDFYARKTNKEFVLYNDFPKLDALRIYLSERNLFPLYEYGLLNVKELVEIIKHLYQFKSGNEYDILTMGAVERMGESHLYFMVGNNKTLEPYREYNGKFVNSYNLFNDINDRKKNLIIIDTDHDYRNLVNIECLTGDISDEPGLLNYFNEYERRYMPFGISNNKQIFSRNLRSSLNYSGGYKMKGIKDVMDFNIHPFDTYIAKVLISIVIYIRNNNIQELSNDDYNHIFGVLFGEKVDIVEDAKKDIPRQLIYVPNKKTNR